MCLGILVCDIIFGILIVVSIIATSLCCSISTEAREAKENAPDELKIYARKRDTFLKSTFLMMCLEFFLEIGSIVATILVLFISANFLENAEWQGPVHIFFFSAFSLISIYVSFKIQPKRLSVGYRTAFLKMTPSLREPLSRSSTFVLACSSGTFSDNRLQVIHWIICSFYISGLYESI